MSSITPSCLRIGLDTHGERVSIAVRNVTRGLPNSLVALPPDVAEQ